MTRRFIGVRWWLGAAFALVAAVSTAIVVALANLGLNAALDAAFDRALARLARSIGLERVAR